MPTRRAFLLGGLALGAGAGALGWARRAPKEAPAVDRDAFLARLAPILREGIARRDTKHPVFHGDVDWHSAVHGHFALLRIARVTGRHAEGAEAAARSLDPGRLAVEARDLEADPSFEQPYGRAWFLRLALEFEAWSAATGGRDPARLRPMASAVAASLRAHLASTQGGPSTPEYANPCWALAQLHAWYAFAGDAAERAWANELVEARFLHAEEAPSFADDAVRPEFFSRWGNWAYLVATTMPPATRQRFLDAHPLSDEALRPVDPRPGVAHHLGMNWSRAWALDALARRSPRAGDAGRFRAAFEAHVRAGVRYHERFAGDVWAYDHWVPQFAVYALTAS